ncbi:MAG: hypothetical protein UT44_C0017G0007 [Candidatus Levybacteria bacterium GW2011_GWA1_39_32]|nr:MAG: hypothetical protein UT44_C0017G0007 [Candidatus Levybacteria bacterium GW2011_GWA1_39_32]
MAERFILSKFLRIQSPMHIDPVLGERGQMPAEIRDHVGQNPLLQARTLDDVATGSKHTNGARLSRQLQRF